MQQDPMSSHRPSMKRRLGVGGIVLSCLIMLIAIVLIFNLYTNTVSLVGKLGVHTTLIQPLISCTTPQHALGDSTQTITSGGIKRTFLVHLPPSYGSRPQALVLNYHGYSWTSQIMEHNSGMDLEADAAGFVLVFPQGVDSPPSWNAGVGAYGPTGDADDIQFTRDMLSFLEKNYCLDTHRIYLAGFSLGGGMVYRLACVLADQIAAVATVSGAYYPLPEGCHPSRPISVMEIHGQADTLAPYGGNPATRMDGVQDYLNGWLTRNQCAATSQVFFQKGDVTGIEWTHCASGTTVRHYRISDGGHTWPGTPNTTHVISANVVIWQFVSQYSI